MLNTGTTMLLSLLSATLVSCNKRLNARLETAESRSHVSFPSTTNTSFNFTRFAWNKHFSSLIENTMNGQMAPQWALHFHWLLQTYTVDDTFAIGMTSWKTNLTGFSLTFKIIKSKNTTITIETEENYCPLFLGELITRKNVQSLRHTVYRKKTYMDLYLNAQSH